MVIAQSRRSLVVGLVALSVLGLFGAPFAGSTVMAQGAPFDCPAPTTPTASDASNAVALHRWRWTSPFPRRVAS